MSTLFTKLNLTNQNPILVLNQPDTFGTELQQLENVKVIRKTHRESIEGDAILWIAYPKGTAKQFRCEFNRDNGWTVLGNAGFEPVRQVSIDSDWTALRFRKVEHIKSLNRRTSMAISTEGKQRTSKESTKATKNSRN